jgi:hypothetical protein
VAAAELYAAATGFPLGAHQNNLGTCSYAMFGTAQLGTNNCTTLAACPAGIVVVNDVGAITYGYPDVVEAEIAGLRIIKTRGVVQALVDGDDVDAAVGSLLEINTGTYNLVVDAANANEGTFVCLEANAGVAARRWVEIVNVSH